ncbi:MAG: hypothetical protein EON89_12430, partial [Brevundimonas sp.]
MTEPHTEARAQARKQIVGALVLAGAVIGGALVLTLLKTRGVIEAETASRGVQVVIGLMLAWYGNFMPKQPGGARRSVRAQAVTQAALRVGGWAMTLGGLAYAALWAFAPRDVADWASVVVVAGAMAVTVGYAAWRGVRCRAADVAKG